MTTYIATNRSTNEEIAVRGRTIEAAAQHAAARICRSRRVVARRQTGERGYSGIWQSYRYIAGMGVLTSVGPNIHVRQENAR